MPIRIVGSDVDLDSGEVRTDGESRQLTPKAAAVLRHLCERPGELVTTVELLETHWVGTFPGDNAVQKVVSEIRAAFGDDAKNPRVVRTVSKRGYILIAAPEGSSRAGAELEAHGPASSDGDERRRDAPRPGVGSRSLAARWTWLGLTAVLVVVAIALLLLSRRERGESESGDPWPPLTSIAVLPLDDLSPAGDQGWLANGFSEQLVESLARIGALQVMARTSSEAAKREGLDAKTVGERLGVGTLVEGSVRKAHDQLRITAQLIRTSDGSHLWSGTYDRPLVDVLSLQSEIGQEIAEAIRLELGATDDPSWLQRTRYRTTDVRAWELVRKGVESEGLGTESGFRAEIRLTDDALAIDPRYAQAHAQQGFAYWYLYQYGFDRSAETRERAAAKAREALELEPANASANNLLVELSMHSGRWAEAQSRVEESIARTPWVGPLRNSYAAILLNTGRRREAVDQARRAQSLDPLSPGFLASLGRVLVASGEFDAAIVELERAREAGRSDALPQLLVAYHLAEREPEGLALFEELVEDPSSVRLAYDRGGYAAAARVWLSPSDQRRCDRAPLLAIAAMEEELRTCLEDLVELELVAWSFLGVHPALAPYRDRTWFVAVLEEAGLSSIVAEEGTPESARAGEVTTGSGSSETAG